MLITPQSLRSTGPHVTAEGLGTFTGAKGMSHQQRRLARDTAAATLRVADHPPTIFLPSSGGGYDSPPAVCCLVHEKACDLVVLHYRESEIGRGQNFSVHVIKAERDVREW